jgi:hypothetical protein
MNELLLDTKGVTVKGVCRDIRKTLLLVIRTIDGCYGDGEERRKRLGKKYDEVQRIINYLYIEGDLPL